MKYLRKIKIALVGGFFVVTTMVLGSTTILYAANELPYTFTSGTTISSAQVNANFQELLAQIAVLRAQIAPVSIVGTYDYVTMRTQLRYFSFEYVTYQWMQSGERGTLVFAAPDPDGHYHVTSNPTGGGTLDMKFHNKKGNMLQSPSAVTALPINFIIEEKSLILLEPSTSSYAGGGTSTYSVSGSTLTVVDGPTGYISADGKILILNHIDFANTFTEIMIAIKRP